MIITADDVGDDADMTPDIDTGSKKDVESGVSELLAGIDKQYSKAGAKTPETEEDTEDVVKTPEIPKTGDTTTNEEDKSLARIAAKEKEVRELREVFESDRKKYEAEKAKLLNPEDLRLNPTAALKKQGLDPELLMKQILFEKLPDDSPLKPKLKAELSEYHRDKQIADLRKEIADKETATKNAAESARQYQDAIQKLDEYVAKFKDENKELNVKLPHLVKIGKQDAATIKDLVLEEMISDAARRYARGEAGDPLSHEEAAGRVNLKLDKLSKFFNNDEKSTITAPKRVSKQVVNPGDAVAKSKVKQTTDEAVNDLIAKTMREYNTSEVNLGRR